MRILLIILACLTLTGCTSNLLLSEIEYVENDYKNDPKSYTVCIDDVEYIFINIGHQGYMAPHLKADKLNNPKVIKCEGAKSED